jgi:hypothetical protein
MFPLLERHHFRAPSRESLVQLSHIQYRGTTIIYDGLVHNKRMLARLADRRGVGRDTERCQIDASRAIVCIGVCQNYPKVRRAAAWRRRIESVSRAEHQVLFGAEQGVNRARVLDFILDRLYLIVALVSALF